MERQPDNMWMKRPVATKTVLVNFPPDILQEVDALCDFNHIERTDFLIIAAKQLIDYLDRKVGAQPQEEKWTEPEYADTCYYDGEEDDGVLEAAEDTDDE